MDGGDCLRIPETDCHLSDLWFASSCQVHVQSQTDAWSARGRFQRIRWTEPACEQSLPEVCVKSVDGILLKPHWGLCLEPPSPQGHIHLHCSAGCTPAHCSPTVSPVSKGCRSCPAPDPDSAPEFEQQPEPPQIPAGRISHIALQHMTYWFQRGSSSLQKRGREVEKNSSQPATRLKHL